MAKTDFESGVEAGMKFEAELDRAVDDINSSAKNDTPASSTQPSIGSSDYPKLARLIDIVAHLVLLAALLMPIVRFGLGSMRLIDQSGNFLIFGGSAMVGLLGSLARKRLIAFLAGAAYGALFAGDIWYTNSLMAETRQQLKNNIFGALFPLSFEWGCVVIAICVLLIFFSKEIARSIER